MKKLFGIGLGPGDPELLTAKAIRLIQMADLIICPVKSEGANSTAYEIVKPYLNEGTGEVRMMVFPMVGRSKDWESSWVKNAAEIELAWNQGKSIAFLTLGDPSIYSTWSYLQAYLPDELEREVVPGITSFCAVSARLGSHLSLGDENMAILSKVNGETLDGLETWADTVVIMKPKRSIETLKSWIEEKNLTEEWILVSECGKENEKVMKGDLSQLNCDLPYFSTMLIRRGKRNE